MAVTAIIEERFWYKVIVTDPPSPSKRAARFDARERS